MQLINRYQTIISLLITFSWFNCHSQSIWSNPSYKKNNFIIYSGSGASSRHFEKKYLESRYDYYLKSPFLSIGLDYCFSETPNAYWGIGLYSSSLLGKKKYTERSEEIEKTWSSSFVGLKLTHHSKFFVTKRFDLSSCYVLGMRIKNYHQFKSEQRAAVNNTEGSVLFAGGICLMAKYYINDHFALYAEGAIGLRLDLLQIGICRKFQFKKPLKYKFG